MLTVRYVVSLRAPTHSVNTYYLSAPIAISACIITVFLSYCSYYCFLLPSMPVQRAAKGTKRSAGLAEQPAKRVRVTRGTGTNTQPLELADTQQSSSIISAPKLPQRQSPRKALADAASQATKQHPFESQLLLNAVPNEAIVPPIEGSNAATVASAAGDNREVDSSFDERFLDNFDGID